MLLTGTFSRSIDEKQRLAIPKRLRDALGCPEGGNLYVAPGTNGSLSVYTEESFAQLADRLTQVSLARREVRDFARLFYGSAQRVELDRQGRVRLPGELIEQAALGKEVVLVGVRDHVELWASQRWEAYLHEKQSHFDEIAEAAFGGPD